MGNSNGIMNESPIPLYYQIYVDLKNKLLINKLVDENGKLPAEKELAESYKVSRVTMRQAIAELEKDGLIVRYIGRGSFLKSQPNPILHKLGLPGQAGRVRIDKSPEIVELSHFDTTYEYIGRALNYEGDIFFIKRIFRVDGNPIAINRIWIPAVFTPELDKKGLCVEGSLSKTLKEVYHLKIDRRENVIEAVRPSVSDIELLKITYDTLILQITSKSFLKDNVPYEYSVTSWIGDAIRLEVDVEDIEHGITFLK